MEFSINCKKKVHKFLNPFCRGKPKKGRTASAVRDGKRNRALSEADFDDEDDPDMSLRWLHLEEFVSCTVVSDNVFKLS